MKYLIFTDLHGVYTSLEKVLKIYENDNFDKIVILGDILYHGPRNDIPKNYHPKKVIDLLLPYMDKVIWIQGNCDAYVDTMVLKKKYLTKKKVKIGSREVVFVHGHQLTNNSSYLAKKGYFAPNTVVINGHFHIFEIKEKNDVTYISIGSTSIPKDGRKQYAIIEDSVLYVKDLDSDELLGQYKF